MRNPDPSDDSESPSDEPETPLISAADIPIEAFPIVHIPERRVHPIEDHARQIANHSAGTVDNHRTGKLREYAVAKALDLEDKIDFQVYTDGGDGGSDLRYNSGTINVKTASRCHVDPSLIVDAHDLRADHYVLASRLSRTDVRLIGAASRDVVADQPVWPHNGGPSRRVEQKYLDPFPPNLN